MRDADFSRITAYSALRGNKWTALGPCSHLIYGVSPHAESSAAQRRSRCATIPLIDPPQDTEAAKTAKPVSTYTFPGPNLTPEPQFEPEHTKQPAAASGNGWRARGAFPSGAGTCLDARKIPGQETAGRHQVHRYWGCTDNRKVGRVCNWNQVPPRSIFKKCSFCYGDGKSELVMQAELDQRAGAPPYSVAAANCEPV